MMADETTQSAADNVVPLNPQTEAAPDPTAAASAAPAPDPSSTPPSSSGTDEPSAPAGPTSQNADPVRVDNLTRRDDNDALEGHFAKVVDGEHAGQTVVFQHAVANDPEDGYPQDVLVTFRDATYHLREAVVPYAALRPVPGYLGGR